MSPVCQIRDDIASGISVAVDGPGTSQSLGNKGFGEFGLYDWRRVPECAIVPAATNGDGLPMPIRPRRGDPPLFHLVLIKPTHYDDDGYPNPLGQGRNPVQHLACLNGLAEDATSGARTGGGNPPPHL